MLDRWRAHLLDLRTRLSAQDFEYALDTGLAEGTEPPEIRPADADSAGAHAQRFHNVGAAAEAGIDQHRHRPRDLHDLRQRLDRRRSAVVAAPAMVRHDDAVDASLGRELGILPGDDALEHHLHLGLLAQTLDVVPAH